METELRILREDELEQAWELDRESFNTSSKGREHFLRFAVADQYAGLFEDGRLVSASRALPSGQFFGGRSVRMGGLSSVATAPDARGRGYGKQVVRRCLEIMRERGDAISSLYPATTGLYRPLGWELSGMHMLRKVAPRVLQALAPVPGVRLRRGGAGDAASLVSCYRAFAPHVNGFLDRSPRRWEWLCEDWMRNGRIFLAEEEGGGAVEGYVVYHPVDGEWQSVGGPFRLLVDDFVAATPRAASALWRLLGSWASQVEEIVYRAPAEDPLLLLLPEQELGVLAEVRWMTRIIDAAAAVEARGFPPGVDAEVHLALRDSELPDNDGRFVLTVGKGRGRLEPGGSGAVALDIGAFASLYTGWASCALLSGAGLLGAAPADARAALDAAFSGPTPWMPDQF